jgi:hypothetical protein
MDVFTALQRVADILARTRAAKTQDSKPKFADIVSAITDSNSNSVQSSQPSTPALNEHMTFSTSSTASQDATLSATTAEDPHTLQDIPQAQHSSDNTANASDSIQQGLDHPHDDMADEPQEDEQEYTAEHAGYDGEESEYVDQTEYLDDAQDDHEYADHEEHQEDGLEAEYAEDDAYEHNEQIEEDSEGLDEQHDEGDGVQDTGVEGYPSENDDDPYHSDSELDQATEY